MTRNPTSDRGQDYIIITIDYFLKWAEAMPTFFVDDQTIALFEFNLIISKFDVPKAIVTDHGSQFCNQMMTKLNAILGFHHENSSPYYPQGNE